MGKPINYLGCIRLMHPNCFPSTFNYYSEVMLKIPQVLHVIFNIQLVDNVTSMFCMDTRGRSDVF